MVLLASCPVVLAFFAILPAASFGQGIQAPTHFYPYGGDVSDDSLAGSVVTIEPGTRIVFNSFPRDKLYVRNDIDLIPPCSLNCTVQTP